MCIEYNTTVRSVPALRPTFLIGVTAHRRHAGQRAASSPGDSQRRAAQIGSAAIRLTRRGQRFEGAFGGSDSFSTLTEGVFLM